MSVALAEYWMKVFGNAKDSVLMVVVEYRRTAVNHLDG
jgi:hypothetical protein